MMITNRIVRSIIFIALVAMSICYIPIPSRITPDASMPLNSWLNKLSPRIAACGFSAFSPPQQVDENDPVVHSRFYPFCQVQGETLLIARSNESVQNPDRLTFRFDNIVALSVLMMAILFAYTALFCCELSLSSAGSLVLAAIAGLVFFTLGFATRGFFLGVYVISHRVEDVVLWDYVSRFVLTLLLVSGWTLGFASVHPKKLSSSCVTATIAKIFLRTRRFILLLVFLFLPLAFSPSSDTSVKVLQRVEVDSKTTMESHDSTNKQDNAETIRQVK